MEEFEYNLYIQNFKNKNEELYFPISSEMQLQEVTKNRIINR